MGNPSGELLSGSVLNQLAEAVPGLQTRRWREAAMRELTMGTRRYGLPREFVELVRGFGPFIPDAYVVDRQERLLHFFEVEVYNPMRQAKLDAYARLWSDMDYYGIDFGVYVVNKYGHVNRVNLQPYYFRTLAA